MLVTLQNVIDGNVRGKPLGDDERCYLYAMRFRPFIARQNKHNRDFVFQLNYKGIKDVKPSPVLDHLVCNTETGVVRMVCAGSFTVEMKNLRRAFL